jgi:hypothetical protein
MCFHKTRDNSLSVHINTPYKLNTTNTVKLSVVELKDGVDITTIYNIPTLPMCEPHLTSETIDK